MRNEIFIRTQEDCRVEFSFLPSFQSGTYFKVFSFFFRFAFFFFFPLQCRKDMGNLI